MTAGMTETKRVRRLRFSIAKQIPKFPNDKQSLQALQGKSLAGLLINYANWALRYVTPRPRAVRVEPTASCDVRWQSLASKIEPFLDKVRCGDDLTPHLSLQPHTRGYTPAASSAGPNTDRWADKDFLLNVMGYYHFHLGKTVKKTGHASRSSDVLFAAVLRDRFEVVGLFDHSVFENGSEISMSNERQRLWQIFEERTLRGVAPGTVVVPPSIALSGHSLYVVKFATDCARIIRETDSMLDDPAYVRRLYDGANLAAPSAPKVRWHFRFLSLGLLDEQSGVFFVFRHGPN